ncbi:unnamed protein product, partial [Didymodactylos carnosus]
RSNKADADLNMTTPPTITVPMTELVATTVAAVVAACAAVVTADAARVTADVAVTPTI